MKAATDAELAELLRAFPRSIEPQAAMIIDMLARSALVLSPGDLGPVLVQGERLRIPQRIYLGTRAHLDPDTPSLRLVANCLLTRHHDGYVRETALRRVIQDDAPWVAPYVVQLVGEYVLPIVEAIDAELQERHAATYGAFVRENPQLMALTAERIRSRWTRWLDPRRLEASAWHPAGRIWQRLARWAALP